MKNVNARKIIVAIIAAVLAFCFIRACGNCVGCANNTTTTPNEDTKLTTQALERARACCPFGELTIDPKYKEYVNDEGYTDNIWTVTVKVSKKHEYKFHIIDNHYASYEGESRTWENDSATQLVKHAFEEYKHKGCLDCVYKESPDGLADTFFLCAPYETNEDYESVKNEAANFAAYVYEEYDAVVSIELVAGKGSHFTHEDYESQQNRIDNRTSYIESRTASLNKYR